MNSELQLQLGERYRLERKLGEGGMGTVFLATDVKLSRMVAVKTVSTVGLTEEDMRRFQLEAETTARLQHAHIVQVLDIGLGRPPFIVLEPLAGESLRQTLLREHVVAQDRACTIAVQVLSALAAAHRAGVVHRDIKPANIFLVETPAPGVFAKVLDFGIARLMGAQRITALGHTIGTSSYMSPEQHRGNEVDGRSDVFSVGVLLYEMLAGKKPFAAQSPEHEVALLLGGARPPSIPNCPPGLERMVFQCLELTPDRRFATADQAIAALERFIPSLTHQARAIAQPQSNTGSASVRSTTAIPTIATAPQINPRSASVRSTTAIPTIATAPLPNPSPVGAQYTQMIGPENHRRRSALWVAVPAFVLLALAGGAAVFLLSSRAQEAAPAPSNASVTGTFAAPEASSVAELTPGLTNQGRGRKAGPQIAPAGSSSSTQPLPTPSLSASIPAQASATTAPTASTSKVSGPPRLGSPCTGLGAPPANYICHTERGWKCDDFSLQCGDHCEPRSTRQCETCGVACKANEACLIINGDRRCWSCPPDFSSCGLDCAKLSQDPRNCGACGHNCERLSPTQHADCVAGKCVNKP